MGFRYQQPDNEDAFEEMCLRLYRKVWKNESLQLYAKRGENQDGVDIHDPACLKPVRAVQCKHHEPTKNLTPAEIKVEVAKAEKSQLPIEHYVIATTAKKSKNAQDAVVKLNSRPDVAKKFTVELQFWEEICEHLSQLPPVQAYFIVGGRDAGSDVLMSILQDRHIAAIVSEVLRVSAGETSTGSFADIEQLLIERNFDAARHELDKLPVSDELAKLPSGDHYRILRLRAKLAWEVGQFDLASQQFLAAFELQPDLEQAKHNRVLAYSLKPDSVKAYELASQYVADGLISPAMLCRLIENASDVKQINEHMPLIRPHLSTNEDINIALCHKLVQLGDCVEATEAGERAVTIAPDSSQAHFAAALSLHNAAVKGNWRNRKTRLEQSLWHYDAAVADARNKKYTNLLPEVLINRACAHVLTGNETGAAADYRAAIETANAPAIYAAHAVSYFLHRQDFASAWELLVFLEQETAEGRFLITVTEFCNTDNNRERRRYLEQMKQLAGEEWPRSVESRLHCVNWALLLKDRDYALSCVTNDFKEMAPFQAYTALAWIALEYDSSEAAEQYAERALEQELDNVHPRELRLLADILSKLYQPTKALDVLEQVVTPGVLNDDMKLLVACAQRAERHDLLLRVCRELRDAGAHDYEMQRLELRLLERYAPEQGLALAEEFIETSTSPAYFVALRNVLASRLDRTKDLQLDAAALPAPADLSPRESRLVVQPYTAVGRFDDAIRFLHAQLRLYFDDEQAHANYVFSFLTYGVRLSLRKPPLQVEPQCAVSIQGDDGMQRWVSIEDDNPLPSRREVSASSELAQRLIGRKVGDIIELPGSLIQAEKVAIKEIQTKYVRAFQDSLQHFRDRFPETSFIQQVYVGSGDECDPTPIIESVKERYAYVEQCIEFYTTNPCTLHLFAEKLSINELDAIKALAKHPNGLVKCCQTTPNDFAHAVDHGVTGNVIVLDITAIVTLTLVDGWSYLDPNRQYFVSLATKAIVEQWVNDLDLAYSREGGHAFVSLDNQLVFQETTQEQYDAQHGELESIKQMIETHCECRSCESVAALVPEKRTAYERVAGFHNVEAISLAKDLGATLWSDDHLLSFIAKNEFDVNCVWTQLMLRGFVDGSHLRIEDYNLVSAKLASWNFTQILWNPSVVIRAGEHANWNPEHWPLRQCIALIKNSTLPLPSRARIALDCLKLLRRSNCVQLLQSAVIQAILSAVDSRRAIVWMYNRLDDEFLIDVPSAEFLGLELAYWLDMHPR